MKYKIYKNNFKECKDKGVYLIRNLDNGLLKIGKASNIIRRLNEIEGSFKFCGVVPRLNIEAFIEYDNNSKLESYFHKIFNDYRIQNEWFDIYDSNTVLDCISKFIEPKVISKNTNNNNINLIKNNNLEYRETHKISTDFLSDKDFSYKIHLGIFLHGGYKDDKCYIIKNITKLSHIFKISKNTIREKINNYYNIYSLNSDADYIENISSNNFVEINNNTLSKLCNLEEIEIRLFIFIKSFSSDEIIGQTQKKILESIGYSSKSKSNEKLLRDATHKLKELGLIETKMYSDGIKKYIIYYKK